MVPHNFEWGQPGILQAKGMNSPVGVVYVCQNHGRHIFVDGEGRGYAIGDNHMSVSTSSEGVRYIGGKASKIESAVMNGRYGVIIRQNGQTPELNSGETQ